MTMVSRRNKIRSKLIEYPVCFENEVFAHIAGEPVTTADSILLSIGEFPKEMFIRCSGEARMEVLECISELSLLRSGEWVDLEPDGLLGIVKEAFFTSRSRCCIAGYSAYDGGSNVATSIDCIDSDCNIYMITTTNCADSEYVKTKLSLDAHIFELANPHMRVKGIKELRVVGGTARIFDIERLPTIAVEQILGEEPSYAIEGSIPPEDLLDDFLELRELDLFVRRMKVQVSAAESTMLEKKKKIKSRIEKSEDYRWIAFGILIEKE